jgi:ribonuclease HI
MTITAAADGSALGNPGPAGWAWYIDENNWAAGGWKHATNNQGELKAVLELFRATAHVDDDLLVLCDSQYVINSVTKWMRGWKAKGWRKADGKAVMNLELLQEIDEALVGRKYRFEWVKGHANHPLNEAADSRARAVSEAYQRGGSIPTGPGFVAGGAAPAPVTTSAPRAAENLGLFDFEIERPHTVQVSLSADELGRLKRRATSRGVSPEELLRDLI